MGTYTVQCIVEIGSIIIAAYGHLHQRSKQLLRVHTNRPLIECADKKVYLNSASEGYIRQKASKDQPPTAQSQYRTQTIPWELLK